MHIVSLPFPPFGSSSADERSVLVTGQLSKEINEIITEIGQLFGVLSEDVVQLV